MVRKLTKKILEFLPYYVVPKQGHYVYSEKEIIRKLGTLTSFDEIHQYLVRVNSRENNKPITIFDVGAHTGESVTRFRALFPNSIIHA